MPRFPQPYFRAQRDTWCVQIDGKQITLGHDREAAFREYHRLMSGRKHLQPRVGGFLVVTALDLFLDWCQKNRAQRTYDWYFDYLQSFAKAIPDSLTVVDLKPLHVQGWVDSNPGWKTGKRGAIVSVQRALTWAVKQGHIAVNPVRHMEKPQPGRREQLVSTEQYEKIFSLVKDQDFQDVLELSWETSARPHELFTVEAKYVDLANARWIFPVKESKGKKIQRVVYLTEKALAITQRLVLKTPTGPLLRNTDGVPWTGSAVNCRFQRIRDKLGVKYSLYALRHSFCTFALEAGQLDAVTVSMLMGHRDTAMISRHYSHLVPQTQNDLSRKLEISYPPQTLNFEAGD